MICLLTLFMYPIDIILVMSLISVIDWSVKETFKTVTINSSQDRQLQELPLNLEHIPPNSGNTLINEGIFLKPTIKEGDLEWGAKEQLNDRNVNNCTTNSR